jgi:methyl-accepting chemotaxis protein
VAKVRDGKSLDSGAVWVRVLVGAVAGLLFPLAVLPFVTPKSAASFAACVVLGAALGAAFSWFSMVIAQRRLAAVLDEVLHATGMTLGISTATNHDGVSSCAAEIDRVLGQAATMLDQMRSVNGRIRRLSADILSATEQQASGAAEQASAVAQTSATLEELAQTSKQIAENSEMVVRVAERTLASVEEGMGAVSDTADGIEEIRSTTQQSSDRILALGERSQEIGRVLTIIDEIAEQTKILALNAAIEAARAGEAGKGFAVVAEEIRKLADSVTESTQEIGRVVREIQASTSALVMSTERAAKKVDEGKTLAARTAETLERIVAQVEETTDAAKQISIATQQQRTASDQVVVSMREVALVSRQSAESSRQVSGAVMDLDGLADALQG